MKSLKQHINENTNTKQVDEAYLRLPGKIIGDDFMHAQKELVNFYEYVKKGNDYDSKRMQNIIGILQKIDRSAQKLEKGDVIESVNEAKSISMSALQVNLSYKIMINGKLERLKFLGTYMGSDMSKGSFHFLTGNGQDKFLFGHELNSTIFKDSKK